MTLYPIRPTWKERVLPPLVVALWLVLCASAVARAQNPCGAWNKIQTDSLVGETQRRSATTGRLLAPRPVVVTRLAVRIDSLDATCPKAAPDTVRLTKVDTLWLPTPVDSTRPATVAVGFDYTTTVGWPGGIVGNLPTGSSLLCALVDVGGTLHLGDRAVNAQRVSADSIAFTPATFASSAALRTACAPFWPDKPVSTMKVWKTFWSSERVHLDLGTALPVAQGQKP